MNIQVSSRTEAYPALDIDCTVQPCPILGEHMEVLEIKMSQYIPSESIVVSNYPISLTKECLQVESSISTMVRPSQP
jgi:hypothetical protein